MYANPADYFMKIITFNKNKNEEDHKRLKALLSTYKNRIAPNVEIEA
jgi:hypothetical protein